MALKACINSNAFAKGKRIILQNITANINKHSTELQNTIIHFYAHFGDLSTALFVFDKINSKPTAVINGAMHACLSNKDSKQCLAVYDTYPNNANNVCHTLAIKACLNLNDFERGKAIHQSIQTRNNNSLVQTTLIDFYGHFSDVKSAENIFDALPQCNKDKVCVGAMMKCLINNGQSHRALLIYDTFNPLLLLSNDSWSTVLALKACANVKDFEKGKEIIKAMNDKMCLQSIEVSNTLIDFYGQSNEIKRAKVVFDSIPDLQRDIIAVNAMMNAYFENGAFMDCIHLFQTIDLCQLCTQELHRSDFAPFQTRNPKQTDLWNDWRVLEI